jgi:signal transduction histidine kinase
LAAKRELESHHERLEELVRERTATVQRQAAELEEALAQEKRLSEMQRSFVSMASHEFRTPLAIIDGSAQRIERRFTKLSPEDLSARIRKIRFAVKRMTSLMESTLAAARMEAGKIQVQLSPVDGRAILEECCAMQQELTPGHSINFDDQGLPDEMITDPQCLTQMITNLLSNAVKYSPDADRVDVSAWLERDDVLIAVQDYGVGIDEEEQDQMFTRFFRAKTSLGIPGTGIGLNLAQMLAEEHGGGITLSSGKGEGSVFTLRLPVIAKAADSLAEAS